MGSESAFDTVSSAAGSSRSAARRSSESASASRWSRCAPATSMGMRMWRPFALFPFRLVISMMWKPNWESTGWDTFLSGSANAAESNAGSMLPLVHSPRSPPVLGRHAVGRLASRHVGERRAGQRSRPRAESARAWASAVVGGVGEARAAPRSSRRPSPRPLEVVLVRAVVRRRPPRRVSLTAESGTALRGMIAVTATFTCSFSSRYCSQSAASERYTSAVTTRSSLERRIWSRYCASSAGEILARRRWR